jgi:CTP synthase
MDANTTEAVIDLMEEQKQVSMKGGTMRLGAYPCQIRPGTLAHRIYGQEQISERHRHRWEFNNKYLQQFETAGMVASGRNTQTGLVEIIELPSHPFFIGSQYHPELKSTVENPHPLFVHFVAAARQYSEQRTTSRNPLLQSEMI